jgi:ABC-type dipeptide/oligopeptide/nickel transport system permease subunit
VSAPRRRAASAESPPRNLRAASRATGGGRGGLVVARLRARRDLRALIAPHDPYATDLFRRLQPPAWMEGGEWAYPLGCDALGRDILSRMIYGARISIFIGATVVPSHARRRHLAGLAAGYLRGWSTS